MYVRTYVTVGTDLVLQLQGHLVVPELFLEDGEVLSQSLHFPSVSLHARLLWTTTNGCTLLQGSQKKER